MPLTPLVFDLQSNPGRYGGDGGGRLINCFPEQAGKAAKTPLPFYPTEGLPVLATLTGGGKTRGAISLGPHAYVVSGPILFRVGAGGGSAIVGGVPGGDPVFMARNRKSPNAQIAIASQGLRYIVENNSITTVADTDLPGANSVTSIGGFFVWTIPDGRFFINTLPDEGEDFDPLDFATAEANPDGLLVAEARAQEVILFGPNSIEFWANTGALFPFERNSAATLQNLGLLCQHSVRDLNDVKFFVASDATVRMLAGYDPKRISTHAVERDIDAAEKTTITATAYSLRGHLFYHLSSPDWTWTYDALTGLWHERQSYQLPRWRGEVFMDINGTKAVGDYVENKLYKVDPDSFVDASSEHVFTIRTAPMHAYPNSVGINALYIDTIPGAGLNTTNLHSSDPGLMMRYSDDGGKSWNGERVVTAGEIGDFGKRVKFFGLGQAGEDGRIFELSMSAPVIRGITGASIDIEVLEP